MANNEPASPQKVNPFLLVLLGIVVIGGGIYYFTSQPKQQTPVAALPTSEATGSGVNDINHNRNVPESTNGGQALKENEAVEEREKDVIPISSLKCNPFLTPSMYVESSSSEHSNSAPNVIQPQPSVTPAPAPTPQPVIVTPNEPELRLGGVFARNGDKLALIYYNNRGNILRRNDTLRGSGYSLKIIESNSVTLADHNGKEIRLRLEKKPKGGA